MGAVKAGSKKASIPPRRCYTWDMDGEILSDHKKMRNFGEMRKCELVMVGGVHPRVDLNRIIAYSS
jgi:hypothetical protein